jgi:uncharacterized membrane protein SpoIIM required for sporulation
LAQGQLSITTNSLNLLLVSLSKSATIARWNCPCGNQTSPEPLKFLPLREAAFVKRNQDRWQTIEQELASGKVNPDRMAEIFIQLTDDLSFARTKYPKSRVMQYLNNLATKIHLQIYRNKKEEKGRFITFWKYELPAVMYGARKQLLYSLIIFLATSLIGGVSAYYDDTFTRLIMGDDYVNMTLENIKNGNPTNVYASGGEEDMFFKITLNNILVSLQVIAFGLLTSLATGFALGYNGIMLGSFFAFMIAEGQSAQAIPVIMLHGTIELSAIVIAGAGGLILGNSFLFPGTYSRLESFKTGAKKAIKIGVGLVPFFVIAGFIESFITRYAFMHWGFKVLVIGASTFLIVYYFIVYPYRLFHGKLQSDRATSGT